MLAGCTNTNLKPSVIIAASVNGANTTICVKGSGFTPNGPIRSSLLMPDYTVNGQPGPNPIASSPFGNGTANSNGGFQQTMSLSARGALCSMHKNQIPPPEWQPASSEPVLTLVDQTTLSATAAALPPGFLCGAQQRLPPPSSSSHAYSPARPFGDPSACQ
jgi:hypothetical protein